MQPSFDPNPPIDLLLRAFEAIHARNVSALSFEELYHNAYMLTLKKHAFKFLELLEDFWLRIFSQRGSETLGSSQLVVNLIEEANIARLVIGKISDVLRYLDRHVSQSADTSHSMVVPVSRVCDLGKQMFAKGFLQASGVETRLRGFLREVFLGARSIETVQLCAIVDICLWLNIYESFLEPLYLETLDEKFKCDSVQLFSSSASVSDYIHSAKAVLSAHMNFCMASKFKVNTASSAQQVFDRHFVVPFTNEIFNVALQQVASTQPFTEAAQDTITHINALGCRTKSCMEMATTTVRKCIVDQVGNILNRPLDEIVDNLIECRRRFQNILMHSFGNFVDMAMAVKRGFEIALTEPFVVQVLVRFLDEHLKKSDNEEFSQGSDIIALYRHVSDKDFFDVLYRSHLSSRLLRSSLTSQTIDAEKGIISLLKCECGAAGTSRMETMISDIINSMEFNKTTQMADRITVRVITVGIWPLSSQSSAVMNAVVHSPALADLSSLIATFRKHYVSRFQGRKLLFTFNHGSVDMKFLLKDSVFLLNVSPLQAIAVLLIESHGKLSFRELSDAMLGHVVPEEEGEEASKQPSISTESPVAELKRHLMGLYHHPRCQLVITSARDKTINDSDDFSINSDFSPPTISVKMPLAVIRTKPSRVATEAFAEAVGLEDDRKHMVDSAIVRIMKTRKSLDHNMLIAEIIKFTAERFSPTLSTIKGRIENLIEREFIKRNGENSTFYEYVA